MKSQILFSSGLLNEIKKIIHEVSEDKISVYAAQASFFIITSSVPFISIMFALFGIFIPIGMEDATRDQMISLPISESLKTVIDHIVNEISGAPNVSLLSISAITTLWSASRGIAAVRSGIESVYKAKNIKNIFARRLRSIVATLVFIALLAAITTVLLFGDFIAGLLGDNFDNVFYLARTPIFIVILTVLFTLVYYSVAARSRNITHKVSRHIPGAVFSAVGWIVFSYFYSLYIENFPGASYIYGGLAAVCLIMLWIYFCMMILLFGAVINKLYFAAT